MFTIKCDRKHFSDEIKSAMKMNDRRTISTLTKGVNLAEIKDYRGTTLLHLAIRFFCYNEKVIKFLIKNGCDINAQNEKGTTPLLAALKRHRHLVISILLNKKANVFLADNEGTNILNAILKHKTAHKKYIIQELGKYLKTCGLNTNELAPLLLEAGWPIHYAAYIENSEILRLMIEAGCPIDSRDEETGNYTALHTAIYNADIESIKILLLYGADVDIFHENRESPIDYIITNISSSITANVFEIFLKCPCLLQRFNIDGMIQSYASFVNADAQIIKLLVKYKINWTTKDRFGSTLLHFLVLNENEKAVDLILKIEADLNIKDIDGNTPLHHAVKYSRFKWLMGLIFRDADVNAKNNDGHTPLVAAIINDYKEAIDILTINDTILDEKAQHFILNEITNMHNPGSIIETILKQMAVMHVQNEAVSKRNMDLIRNLNIHALFEKYLEELNFMKKEQITINSYISVFHVLRLSKNQLVNCARNDEIVKNLLETDICSKYLFFGKLVVRRFQFARKKQILIQNATDVLSKNFKQLNCNIEIIGNIIRFLSVLDLVTLF